MYNNIIYMAVSEVASKQTSFDNLAKRMEGFRANPPWRPKKEAASEPTDPIVVAEVAEYQVHPAPNKLLFPIFQHSWIYSLFGGLTALSLIVGQPLRAGKENIYVPDPAKVVDVDQTIREYILFTKESLRKVDEENAKRARILDGDEEFPIIPHFTPDFTNILGFGGVTP